MAYDTEAKILSVNYGNGSSLPPTAIFKYQAETPGEETWLREGCIFWRLST